MASTPRAWQVLDTLRTRLQTIMVASGYRTDAGLDVRMERTEAVPSAPYLSLSRVSITRPEAGKALGKERELEIVVEAHIPVSLADAARLAEDISEDIEDALDTYLQQPGALPLKFAENGLLNRPDGLPVMVAQVLLVTRYRR